MSGFSLPQRLLSSLLLTLPACQWVGRYDEFSSTEGESTHRCAILPETKLDARGNGLSRVDLPGTDCRWMDRDEVTVQQYGEWLADSNPLPYGWDPDYCAWKNQPSNPVADVNHACSAQAWSDEYQPFDDDKPIRCVDWCDAVAFCQWSGKHLCHDYVMATQVPRSEPREWYYACSNGQTTVYPWGLEPSGGDCNVGQKRDSLIPAQRGPVPVGVNANCASEFGVRNLIGNVAEWAYGCNITALADRGKVTPCLTRGGAYYEPMRNCIQDGTRPNDTRDPGVGFRCCADLTVHESQRISAQSPSP